MSSKLVMFIYSVKMHTLYYKIPKASTVILWVQSYVSAECNVEGLLSNRFVCLAPPLIRVGGVFPQEKIKVPVKIVSVCLKQVRSFERECVCA